MTAEIVTRVGSCMPGFERERISCESSVRNDKSG